MNDRINVRRNVEAQQQENAATTARAYIAFLQNTIQNNSQQEDTQAVTPPSIVHKKAKFNVKPCWLRTMPMSELFKEEYDYEYDYPMHGLSVSVSEDGSEVDVCNLNKIENKSGNDHCIDAENQAS